MRPPKQPKPGAAALPLEQVLAALRTRPALSGWAEFEVLETGGHTVFITRLRKAVVEVLKEWEAGFLGYAPDWALARGKAAGVLFAMRAGRGEAVFDFLVKATQAFVAVPVGHIRGLLLHPHDFIPEEIRASEEYRAVSLRVHLAGGSDQWASREQLEKFLASGQDGSLSDLDWGTSKR